MLHGHTEIQNLSLSVEEYSTSECSEQEHHSEKRNIFLQAVLYCSPYCIHCKPQWNTKPFHNKTFFAAEGIKITLELEFPFSKQSCNVPLLYTL